MFGVCLKPRTVWYTDEVLIDNIVEIVNYSHINDMKGGSVQLYFLSSRFNLVSFPNNMTHDIF